MMTGYKTLRTFMRKFKVSKTCVLKNCNLVVEGGCFFQQTYKESGCNFILGGEFDRYADYLKTKLMSFIKSNVTCYFIFNGPPEVSIEKRKANRKKYIHERGNMKPGNVTKYCEPVFMRDVYKEVLEELGIKYCVIESNTREAVLDTAVALNSPVITSNIEQCLIGMTCIIPDSLVYDDTGKQISCEMLTPGAYKDHIRIFDSQKPLLLAILNENGPMYDKIPEILGSDPKRPVGPLLYWTKGKKIAPTIAILSNMLDTEAEKQEFQNSVEELRKTMFYVRRFNMSLSYFNGTNILHNNQRHWFTNGVMSGKIATPYINLKRHQVFSGSWVIFDETKRDAMLPSLDIVMYGYSILMDSQEEITFIGRMKDSEYVGIKSPPVSRNFRPGMFRKFIDGALPGFDWDLLQSVPEDSRLLTITLVYYCSKANKEFIKAAYSIILSHVMLGHVAEKVGLIKKSKIYVSVCDDQKVEHCYKECLNAAEMMIDYFYEDNITDTFDRSMLHDLAEFQHCLQHMNYLNNLCGEEVKRTTYYKTYNGTFIFNVLLKLKEEKDPMLFFEKHFKTSPTVLNLYNNIKDAFETLLSLSNKDWARVSNVF